MSRSFSAHALKDDEWLRFSIEAKLGVGGYAKVSSEGTDIGAASGFDLTQLPRPALSTIQVGLNVYAGGSDAWIVDYDNVACDILQ